MNEPATSPGRSDKPRLLVVEDDVGLQKQLRWSFDEYEVLIAGSREEALAQIRRFEPPVVLQDLGLPPDAEGVAEGFATLKEILSLAPHTRVIVITGKVSTTTTESSLTGMRSESSTCRLAMVCAICSGTSSMAGGGLVTGLTSCPSLLTRK